MQAIASRLLPVRGLIEPLAVGGLLRGGLRIRELEAAEQGDAPRIERVAGLARLQLRPRLEDDGAPVANEFAAHALAHRRRHELRCLELLDDGECLCFGTAARLVV